MRKLKRWLGRILWPNSVRCPEEERCLELARQMLDQESNVEEDEHVMKHIEGCYQCYDNYNIEKAIRDVVKRKSKNLKIPVDVIQDIKNKINLN